MEKKDFYATVIKKDGSIPLAGLSDAERARHIANVVAAGHEIHHHCDEHGEHHCCVKDWQK